MEEMLAAWKDFDVSMIHAIKSVTGASVDTIERLPALAHNLSAADVGAGITLSSGIRTNATNAFNLVSRKRANREQILAKIFSFESIYASDQSKKRRELDFDKEREEELPVTDSS